MTFSPYFDHNFLSWVRFVSLETRHYMLQFEHKFCIIWTYIEWVMIVWSRAKVMGISMHMHKVKGAYTILRLHMHLCFQILRTSILKAQNIILWCRTAPRSLGTSKWLIKALKTLVLTYKYSHFVSKQSPSYKECLHLL